MRLFCESSHVRSRSGSQSLSSHESEIRKHHSRRLEEEKETSTTLTAKDSCPLRRLLLVGLLLPDEDAQVNSSGRHLQSIFAALLGVRVVAVVAGFTPIDEDVVVGANRV